MEDIVLYCKSYSNDFLRLRRLLQSVGEYNSEHIPFYISTPTSDRALLIEVLGEQGYCWIADEDIVLANPKADLERYKAMPGGLSQQIIKSEFWRLEIAKNYLCLDSDGVFIKNFYRSDFIAEGGSPYTVLHQNKEFFQLAADRGYLKIEQALRSEAKRVQARFERKGPTFYCAPAPFIWSAKVWESLDREHLTRLNISIWEFISLDYPETLIYGEALLKYRAIPLLAIEPLFRTYHYDWQYYLMRRLGETEAKLRQNYLGVIYQSAWKSELNFESSKKSLLSQILKRTKRLMRYLQSFI